MGEMGNKSEEFKGKTKETLGHATNDDEMKAEGKGDQTKANVKQAGEKIKDAAGNVKDSVTGSDNKNT